MSDLVDHSAVALRRMIGAKEISPVELLEACLARIAAVNPALNAVVAMDEEGARKAAKRAEQAVMRGEPLGLLHGLPIGVKDLTRTAGLRTTWGSPIYADHVPEADDRLVAALREAGAIVLAKTNTPEFGAGANTTNPVYGATRNPFDPARTCGGSSGGSAVALATGMLPLCTGSDMGGSLRIPAAYCGVVGFRTTPGTVPSETHVLAWSPLSVDGPMGRSVDDTAFFLRAMVRRDDGDPLGRNADPASFWPVTPADLAGLRVAATVDLGFAPVEKAVAECFRRAVARLEGVAKEVRWVDPPLADADDVFEIVRAVSFLAAHRERYQSQRDKLGPNIVANVETGLKLSAADAARGTAAHSALYRRFLAFMADFDVLLCPTVGVVPFPVEQLYKTEIDGRPMRSYIHWLACTYGITLTAHPAISVPAGLDPSGTPFGLQLVGRFGEDRRLLEIAKAVEACLAGEPATARPVPALARRARG